MNGSASGRRSRDAKTWDVDVERLFLESRLVSVGLGIARAVRASWLDSRCRALTMSVAGDWRPFDPIAALRAGGRMVMVAGVTSLVVRWLGAGRDEPTTRVLPMVLAVGGLAVSWLVRPRGNDAGRPES